MSAPLRLVAGPPAPPRGPVLRLPALFRGTGDRENRVLRAIAAAVALESPKSALAVVHASKQDPSSVVVDELDEDTEAVIETVKNALDRVPSDATPDAAQRAVATAVGADPVLVNVAIENLTDPEVTGRWVGSLDVALLERAARAALRTKLTERVKPTSETELKTDIATLKESAEYVKIEIEGIKRHLKLEGPPAEGGHGTPAV